MARIDESRPIDREAIKGVYKKVPRCSDCTDEATIWIRTGIGDLFLCDVHAFHLARILMMDIGHIGEIRTK